MTQDDMPMWDDPGESSALRQLLRAGSVENSDYDVERGLARHLAQLQASAPLPAWAVQTSLHKSAGWSVLAWILPPMISAAVVGAWLAIRPSDPAALAAVPAAKPAAQETAALAASAPSEVPAAVAPLAAAAQEPAVAAAPSERDLADQRREHHVVAPVRSVRPVARVLNTRRARGSRADDASYASASANGTTGQGVGSSSGPSGIESSGVASTSVSTAAVSSKAAPSDHDEPALKQEPAAEEPKAKDKEAKAKPAARAKEEESAQDEVTGARLEREMRMLAVAQRVLTDDPARSLRLCRQGESEFRGSMFSAERKQVALLALVQLGRVDQARREGIPFLRAYPNAPWSARLREALSSGHLPNP